MTRRQHDSIMVVVEKLTKATHFIPFKSTHKTDDIAKIFMKEIVTCPNFAKKNNFILLRNNMLNFMLSCN